MPRNNSTGESASGFSCKRDWLHNDKDVNEGMTYDVRVSICIHLISMVIVSLFTPSF